MTAVAIRCAVRSRSALCAACLLLAALPGVRAHEAHKQHATPAAKPSTVSLRLADAALTDQNGRVRHLTSDVLGDRVIVVNFVYTTCTTVCPVSSATFMQLQQALGDEVGRQVQLVSISVDPQRDTPARLKEYAARFDAGEGWTWLTGRKEIVDGVLKSFGVYTPSQEDHPPVTLVGDPSAQRWTRLYGFPGAAELQAQVERVLAQRDGARKGH